MTQMTSTGATCRFCAAELRVVMVDLGKSPLCQTMLSPEQLNQMEPFYPLRADVCEKCSLVQVEEYVSPSDIFADYNYFSSYSDSWLGHMKRYADEMVQRLDLNHDSMVVELASNDGYLLQYFVDRGIPVLGVEPAANVAKVAVDKGVPTLVEFFSEDVARQMLEDGVEADLICGANVLAQVPDLNSFVSGIKLVLAEKGICTIEFPSLFNLIDFNQFDTIYHEHFSYFSLTSAVRVFEAHGMTVFDVEELPSHGGSLRIFARHADDEPITERARQMLANEQTRGVDEMATYTEYGERVEATKHNLLEFLINARRQGRTVVGYGAPGKGNTLLNYCGIRTDLLAYTVDRSPAKHGRYLPGTHIPVYRPERIEETKPDYVLILPWNLRAEISGQLESIRQWGGQFVVPIPELEVF